MEQDEREYLILGLQRTPKESKGLNMEVKHEIVFWPSLSESYGTINCSFDDGVSTRYYGFHWAQRLRILVRKEAEEASSRDDLCTRNPRRVYKSLLVMLVPV